MIYKMQEIHVIFNRQREKIQQSHLRLTEHLDRIYEILENQYDEALSLFKSQKGQFYANQTYLHQVFEMIEQLCRFIEADQRGYKGVTSNAQKFTPYLIDITYSGSSKGCNKNLEDQLNNFSVDDYIESNRSSSHLVFNKKTLEYKNLSRISSECQEVKSICFQSYPHSGALMVSDKDFQNVGRTFSKGLSIDLAAQISQINISGSLVSDEGIENAILKHFPRLKEIDLSGCCLVTDRGVKRLAEKGSRSTQGCLVNIKLNSLNSISEQAVLELIRQSYRLNYLQLKDCRHIASEQLHLTVCQVYEANCTNYKWLEMYSDAGCDLFINKLAYLTETSSLDPLNDHDVEVILGLEETKKHKSTPKSHTKLINGLFFTNCEELNQATVDNLCSCIKAEGLQRLKLCRFVRLNDSHVKALCLAFPNISYLNLDLCFSITNRAMSWIHVYLTELLSLSLKHCRTITDEGLTNICRDDVSCGKQHRAQKGIQLETIDLTGLRFVSDQGLSKLINNHPTLRSITVESCEQLTDVSVQEMSAVLPNLKVFNANYCDALSDASLTMLATRARSLEVLSIEWCNVSQKCVSYIVENLTRLKTLNLNYCPSVCDKEALTMAQKLHSLQVLKLGSCDKISQSTFLSAVSQLRELRHLELKECIGVTDKVIQCLSLSLESRLSVLDLSWCTEISDKALFSLSQYQHHLTLLNLTGCSKVTSIGVEWVSETLSRLEYLNLSLCEGVSDKGVQSLANLTKLRRLYLSEMKHLSDVGLSRLSDLADLEELHLAGCLDISSSSLLAILHNLEKLQQLNLNECSKIKSGFIAEMVSKMRNLKRLEIASIDLDTHFLPSIAQTLSRLQYLNISLCRGVEAQSLISFVEKVPSVVKLDFQNTAVDARTKQEIVRILNSRKLYNITLE